MKPATKSLTTSALLRNGEKGMILSAILQELQTELTAGITSKAQVVYFLANLRKLIEQFDQRSDYTLAPTKFFCDWALHPAMTWNPVGRRLLKTIDQAVGKSTEEAGALLHHMFSMEAFRDNLRSQLITHKLSADAISRTDPWLRFLRLYLRIIQNSPILDGKASLQQIDRIQVRLDERDMTDIPEGATFAFTIIWSFYKKREIIFEWKNQVLHPTDPKPGHFYQLKG